MPPEAILFDLDGTLVDSLPDLAGAVNRLRAELHLPALGLAAVRACVGDGARMLVRRALPEGLFSEACLDRFLADYRRNLAVATRPYPGIRELLEEHSGTPLALVTNKPHEMADLLLRALDLDTCFRIVIGGDSCAEKKPHPLPLQQALAALDVIPGQALMVGDHHTDLGAGEAAGTRTCFCTWGYGHDGGKTPDHRVSSVAELADLLRRTA